MPPEQIAFQETIVAAVASDHPEAQAFLDGLPDHPALRRAGFTSL